MSKNTNHQNSFSSILNIIPSIIGLQIGLILSSKIDKIMRTNYNTPYHLRKRLNYLKSELITKTLEVHEEVIRP